MSDAPEAQPDAVKVVDTAMPAVRDDGVAMIGEYPVNHRLRGEALRKARRKTDPDGILTPEQIAAVAVPE